MMDRMRRPKPPDPMAATMEPIVAEILSDQKRDHHDGRVNRYREEAVTVSQIVRRRREAQRQERQYNVLAPERIGERSKIRTPIVVAPHHDGENQALKGRNHNHDRKRKSEDAGDGHHVLLLWRRLIMRPPARKFR